MRSALLTIVGMTLFSGTNLYAEISWNENLRTARAQAEQEGKLLLLHFYTDNCHWCDKLEAGAFKAPQLAEEMSKHYVPVKIHAAKNPQLTQEFRVDRFPTDVIVTPSGSVLTHGVSPQATQDYVNLLARYAPQAPSAAQPSATGVQPGSQLVAKPNSPSATQAPQSPPTGLSTGAGPQVNQFAAQPSAPANTPAAATGNPYAAAGASQNPYAAAAAAATAPPATATTGLGMPQPSANLAQQNAPPSNGFALPPGMGLPPEMDANPSEAAPQFPNQINASTVGHRTEGMSFAGPAQAPTPEPSNSVATSPATESIDQNRGAPAAEATAAPALAMQGYCPVTVIDEDRWEAGNPDFGLIHLGQLFLFRSDEAMETFRANPEAYTPVMNGMDVVLFFEERRLVQGSREWGMKDPEFKRMFFFANEETMNHFYREHSRYTRSAIEVTRQAAADANSIKR